VAPTIEHLMTLWGLSTGRRCPPLCVADASEMTVEGSTNVSDRRHAIHRLKTTKNVPESSMAAGMVSTQAVAILYRV
jgi:hypothetical protein